MAREPGSGEIRFPLRRPAEPLEEAAPPPPVRSWRPKSAEPDPLELSANPPAPPPPPRQRYAAPPPPPPPPSPPSEPAAEYSTNLPVAYKKRSWKWVSWAAAGCLLLFFLAVGWLAVTAPLSKSLQPPAPPSITLLAADGTPIAKRGAEIAAPVAADKLPAHVRDAFIAIEDRRFNSHWGVDPRGIVRAMLHNASSDGSSQGASTITQQLAKNAFLSSDRTLTRKMREVLIAFWLEAWLSKDEILSRYLSNVYFGDNVYGLRAAARHYFSVEPERLTLSQASMLAGLVKAPSRLAPTANLKGARERQKLVVAAMLDAGMIDAAEARAVRPATLRLSSADDLPAGTYFADFVLDELRAKAEGVATERTIRTTLDTRLQREAERAISNSVPKGMQAAIVAMRPNGQVVALVGGRDYAASRFNRATQARRQPGSTFKLFVYLTALRSGMTPETMVDDEPVTIADWSPKNDNNDYAGRIPLRRAFSRSSNVVAAKLTADLGVANVIKTARDLGVTTPIANEATVGLGTAGMSLLELTSAYAAIANGSYPVRPSGLSNEDEAEDWLASRLGGARRIPQGQLDDMRELLGAVVTSGTGRDAALPIPAFGKTGTTQDNRDGWFVGFAGDLVVGVWIGRDDNAPVPGLSGGGMPTRLWRDYMIRALDLKLPPPPPVVEEEGNEVTVDDVLNGLQDFVEGTDIDTDVLGPRRAPPPRDDRAPPIEDKGPPPRRAPDE